jgi:hypothetical protein
MFTILYWYSYYGSTIFLQFYTGIDTTYWYRYYVQNNDEISLHFKPMGLIFINYSVPPSNSIIYLWPDDGLVVEAETCCHLVTLNKINIHNTSCVFTCESLLLTCIPESVCLPRGTNCIFLIQCRFTSVLKELKRKLCVATWCTWSRQRVLFKIFLNVLSK